MTIRTLVALITLLPAIAAAQGTSTGTTYGKRLSIGSGEPGTAPTVGTVRLEGLGTTGGATVLFKDASHNIIARVIARTDLLTEVAYEDEANIFTAIQTVSGTAPQWRLFETDGPTDSKYTRFRADLGFFTIDHVNDALSGIVSTPWTSSALGSIVLSPYSKQVLPGAPYEGTIGSPTQKWLAGYFAEIQADVLTSSETLATSGGRWLVAPSTTLIEDIGTATTTVKTKHNNLSNGDVIYLENQGRVEFMSVTSAATRINKAGIGNLSAESGTTDWATSGTATLTSSAAERWHGGKSLKWVYTSGTANLVYQPGGLLANSTQYTVSLYVKRSDGAAVVPVAGGAYRLYVDAFNGVVCNATATDVGDAWYRLACTGTTGASSASGTGIAQLPTTVDHYVDAVQVETGATLTPWSRDSSSYTVTRNLDGTGADVWEAGSGIVDTRQTGAGLIDCYATQGFTSASAIGPTCSFMVRTSSTYNAMSPRTAIGNLRGLYGYGSDTYGFATGDASGTYLTLDPTNGLRIIGGGSTKVQIDASGNALFASGNTIIDQSSVRVTARNSALFAAANGYNFAPLTVTGGEFGMFGFDTGTSLARGINIRNVHSTSGAQAQFSVDLGNGGTGAVFLTMIAGTGLGQVDFGGITAFNINGTAGTSVTLTCGAGQAVKNLTVSFGFVTAASCGTP